jgi:hypothetical protein
VGFARAAGGALEDGILMEVHAEEGLIAFRSEGVEIAADSEDDFLRVEELAGVVGGAVFATAATLDARVGLEGGKAGEVGSLAESEVLVSFEGWNFGEGAAGEEDGGGAEDEVEVLGMGDEGEKDGECQCMGPPDGLAGVSKIVRQVSKHQGKNQEGDDGGFLGELFCAGGFPGEPARADEETAECEAGDGDGHSDAEQGGESEVEAAEGTGAIEEAEAEAGRDVVEGDEGE